MNDTGLALIQENRRWSSLANQLYDCLSKEEKDRAFELVQDNMIDELIEAHYQYSLSENKKLNGELKKWQK